MSNRDVIQSTTATMNSLDEKNEDISHIEAAKEESQNVDYSGARTYITTEEKTLIRKQDFIILPTLWLMYFLNFLDRGAIAIARLDGFQKDLKLTSTQYQTCVSGLFIGYILAQIPSSMLPLLCNLQRLTTYRHDCYPCATLAVHVSTHGFVVGRQYPDWYNA